MKKYELGNSEMKLGRKMFRVVALRDFQDVKKGDVGGWVEKEWNLSHKGECWIFDDAWVYDNARVYDDAWVSGDAYISDEVSVYIGKVKDLQSLKEVLLVQKVKKRMGV